MKLYKTGKDIFTLSLGSFVAQLIPFLASLVLARFYTSEQYCNWGVFLSWAAILDRVVMGQYEMSVVRPEREEDARALVRLCMLAGLATMSVFALLLLAGDMAGVEFVRAIPCRYLLPFYVFCLGLIQVYNNYANRHEQYGILALSVVVRNMGQAVSRIALGVANVFSGLVHGAILGALGMIAYCESKTPLRHIAAGGYSMAHIRQVAWRYRYFPMYLLPGSLLNAMSTNLPLLILAAYFSKDQVGHFSMTVSLLLMPVQVIGNAMGKIFYKKASADKDGDESRAIARGLFRTTFLLGAAMCLVLIPFGEEVFSFFLGSMWNRSGHYAMILAPWVWMTLCLSPLTLVFDARDKQHVEMVFNGAMFVLRVLLVWAGGALLADMSQAVLLYSIGGMLIWLAEGYVIFRLIGVKESTGAKLLYAAVALAVLALWAVRTAPLL